MECICYQISSMVSVRKYDINKEEFCDFLRKHKENSKLSNKKISEILNIPLTMVEHWFRKDSCFSIPDADLWFDLKKILGITSNEYDIQVMTFELKPNVYEKSQRVYDANGLCPTLTLENDIYILESEE